MAIYRNLFLEIGGFDPQFGMVGTKIGAHDGTRLVDHIRPRGKIIYTPEAVVYHMVPEWRVTRSYFVKRGFSQGMGDARLAQARVPLNRYRLLRVLVADQIFLAKEIGSLLEALWHGKKDRIFYRFIAVIIRLGSIWERLKLITNFSNLSK